MYIFLSLRHPELDSGSHYRNNAAIADQARNDGEIKFLTKLGKQVQHDRSINGDISTI